MASLKPVLAAVLAVALLPSASRAQVVEQAAAEARARIACGSAQLVSAEYLPNGLLRVTCRQQGSEQQASDPSNPALDAGLTPLAPAAVIATVLVIGVLTGGSSPETVEPAPSTGFRR